MPSNQRSPRRSRLPESRAWRWISPLEGSDSTPAVSVFVTQRAYVRFCAHAGSDLLNEVGGWLVGRWRMDGETSRHFIVIEAILPAPHTRHGSAFLTFTQDSQVALYEELDERFPGKELVGWYHTHPRMGIFLSEYDTWLHRNFFPALHQVALVIEPYSKTGGFFIRRADGALDGRQYYGFYEIFQRSKRSVVHWQNLLPDAPLE
jgi:proteasome lid subunit RPN8/RPN11